MNMPPVVKSLLLVNIAAYIIDELLGNQLSVQLGLFYFEHPLFHIWQPLTYMFMHGGIMHLLFNMFALWMFGRIMEQVWGTQKFLIYYFVCGLGAAMIQELGQVVGLINPFAHTIGASGAVYGILLAFGMTFPNERMFVIPIPFPIKAKYLIGFYIVLEVLEGFGMSDGVAHFAHLGGMLFGAILILIWRKQTAKRSYSQKGSFWTQTTTYDSYDKGNGGVMDKITGLFKKKKGPKMTISYGDRDKDYKYNEEQKQNNDEIDRILDKVRKGGYTSLTETEKAKLFEASKK